MKKCLTVIDNVLSKEVDPAYKRRAAVILGSIDEKKDRRLLEVGCGRGFYVNTIGRLFPKLKIWGVDLNNDYLKKADKLDGKVKLIRADVSKLPFEDNYFDKVIASEILEHVEDDSKALREIFRVLRPGGRLIVTVPNKNYPFLWDPLNYILEKTTGKHLPSNIWWLSGIWADHKRLYDTNDLRGRVEKSGFVIDSVRTVTHYCLPWSHFLFYGIGKNLVEKGLFGQLDRFGDINLGYWGRLVLWPINKIDKLNGDDEGEKNSVNIILLAKKS